MGLDELASVLGLIGYPEGESWFQLSDKVLDWSTKSESANHAVILRRWQKGPTAVVFPRNTNPGSTATLPNPAHTHRAKFPKCWLAKGAYVTILGLTVPKGALNEDSHLCTEEDAATIASVKVAKW